MSLRALVSNVTPEARKSNRPGPRLLAVAILVAGCGGHEPAATSKAQQPVVVTLGVAGPLTGSIAHQGKDDENGVSLAIAQANAKNLVIGGKPVAFRMMSEDDQGDPKIGTLVAQKLVDA